jgi:hypothetical protein
MNIANSINHGEHGSSAQKSIWHSLKMLAPFKGAAIDDDTFDKGSILEGESDFYRFISELYQDMYNVPAKYLIPTKPYDEYIKNRVVKRSAEKEHFTDAKECSLRNTFQQAIQFYPEVFYKLGCAADEICNTDYALVITKSNYASVMESFGRSHVYKENEYRMKAVLNRGLQIDEAGDKYYIKSKSYPKMFLGLRVLCTAPESKYKYMNYLRLDYKGYCRSMPEIDDIRLTMKEEHSGYVDLIYRTFEGQKIRYKVKPLRNITSGFEWKVDFTLNGKNIFGFYAEPDYLKVCIYFNNAKNITELGEKLRLSNMELYDWFCGKFPERLCKCPNNRVVRFGDTKRRICGLSNRAEIDNPNDRDISNCIAVTDVFRSYCNTH